MSKKLEGKVAVVTGASKGIGASLAKALAEEGASQPGDDRNRGSRAGGVVGTDFQKAVEAQAPLGRCALARRQCMATEAEPVRRDL